MRALASSILRYSIEAKRVKPIGTGGDKSFHDMFTCVLKFLQCFKESKEKKTKNGREEYDGNKDRTLKR